MKKAYTLIEVLVSIAVMLILFSIVTGSSSFYFKIKKEIEISQFLYEAEETLSYGKNYCINKNTSGSFYTCKNGEQEYIVFNAVDGEKKEVVIPKSIKVKKDYTEDYQTYYINTDGVIESATLKFIDDLNSEWDITIRPGGNVITIK